MSRSLADVRHIEDLVAPDAHRYVQLGELGRGGLGKVALVRDRRLGREIAIKQLADDQRERFLATSPQLGDGGRPPTA